MRPKFAASGCAVGVIVAAACGQSSPDETSTRTGPPPRAPELCEIVLDGDPICSFSSRVGRTRSAGWSSPFRFRRHSRGICRFARGLSGSAHRNARVGVEKASMTADPDPLNQVAMWQSRRRAPSAHVVFSQNGREALEVGARHRGQGQADLRGDPSRQEERGLHRDGVRLDAHGMHQR